MPSTGAFWLVALPLLASAAVYLVGRAGTLTGIAQPKGSRSRGLAIIVLLLSWVPFVNAARSFLAHGPIVETVGMISLRVDGLTLLLAAVTLALGLMVVLFSGPDLAGEIGEEKFYAAVVAMIGAVIAVGAAGDLFNLWVWFEAMAVSSYLLVVFDQHRAAALEAGVKYLVQSVTGSLLVVLGIALVLAQTGTLDLAALRVAAHSSPALLAAGGLFLIGFGVKAALVPLHTWLPDAHAEAPSGISALLSGIVIETGLIALIRVLQALAPVTDAWGLLLMTFGALNLLAGNLLALRQTYVKRMLAYSSISHIGYMLVGVGIAFSAGQAAGMQGASFHLLTHGFMKGLAFLAAGALLYAVRPAGGGHEPLKVADLAGAAQRYPVVALAMSVAVLGLGGVPPLAGFMSKWQILVAGFQSGSGLIYGVAAFAAINSVLSLGYYGPLVNMVYRKQPSAAVAGGRPMPFAMHVPLAVLTLAVLAFGVWPPLARWLWATAGSALAAGL
jgi:proton-translocating NADH-quinone oxidoreductase chain N